MLFLKAVLSSIGIETNGDELDLRQCIKYQTWIQKMHKTSYKHGFIAGVGLNFDPIEFRPVESEFNGLCSGLMDFSC